jgi:hypothetical protein
MLRLHPYPTVASPKLMCRTRRLTVTGMRWDSNQLKSAVVYELHTLFHFTIPYGPVSVECQRCPCRVACPTGSKQILGPNDHMFPGNSSTPIPCTEYSLLFYPSYGDSDGGRENGRTTILIDSCNYSDSRNLHFLLQASAISFNLLHLSFVSCNIYFPHKDKVVSVLN